MKFIKLFICMLFLFAILNPVEGSYMTSMAGEIPLVAQKISVKINNQIATTKIEMSFYNQYSYTVQPNFKFPINESASVQKFSLTDSSGNVFEGKIGEKEEVKSSFDNAVAESVMPAMAVQQKNGVFETAIGSIAPKSNASVILEYCEILPYQNGKVAYVLPLSMQDYKQSRNVDSISAIIEIKDEKSIVGVDTSLFPFPVNVERVNENQLDIVFELANLRPERNFVVSYELKADRMVSNLITTRPAENEDGYFLLIVSPQEVFAEKDVAKRDIVFVVDVSGSMAGEKLRQTKKAFEFFIKRLNSDDRFNILSFDNNVYSFNPGLLPFNETNRESAVNYIKKLRAGSTTNINQALLDALGNFSPDEKRTKAVIFLTDGEPCGGVTNINQICQNINKANTNDIRLFCVGVGRRLNTTLLNKLALENRGETLFIDESKSEIDSELMAFYKGISTPLLVDPVLEWEGIKVTEVYPKTLPNIYHGTQIVVSGRYSDIQTPRIVLKGDINSAKQSYPISAQFKEKSDDNLFVSRYWGKAKADYLQKEIDAYGYNADKKDEIVFLSKKYQFLTRYTSFLAVSEAHVEQIAKPKEPVNKVVAKNQKYPASRSIPTPRAMPPVVKQTPAKPISLWGAQGFLPFAALAVPNFRKAREQARGKACASNIRVLLGAIEMYNMDHAELMTVIDQDALVQKSYLKAAVQCPESGGRYGTIGDVSKDGIIVCSFHGTVNKEETEAYLNQPVVYENNDVSEFNPAHEYRTNKSQRTSIFAFNKDHNYAYRTNENTPWTVRIWNNYLSWVVNLLINIPLFLLGVYCTYKIIQFVCICFYIVFIAPIRYVFSLIGRD